VKKIIFIILICILFLFACNNSTEKNDGLTNEEILEPSNKEKEITLKIYDPILEEAKEYTAIADKNYSIDFLWRNEHKGYDFVGFSYTENGEIIKKSTITFNNDTTLFANYTINKDFFKIDKSNPHTRLFIYELGFFVF
jgi:hypothetical protein